MCIFLVLNGGPDAAKHHRETAHKCLADRFHPRRRTNVSAISDAALAEAVRAAKAEAWARENAEAIAERRAWIEANSAPLADLQVLKID